MKIKYNIKALRRIISVFLRALDFMATVMSIYQGVSKRRNLIFIVYLVSFKIHLGTILQRQIIASKLNLANIGNHAVNCVQRRAHVRCLGNNLTCATELVRGISVFTFSGKQTFFDQRK